ncbi:hypothetical protein Q3G72_024867 [Acer saccharum]|nr:hypothetical protein Q3G72_024867 [Acer saccharum]
MSQGFVFSAECEREKNEVVKEKPPDPKSSMKRARGLVDEGEDFLRKTSGGSFKSKLLGMAGPSSWEGFGAVKEKLKIADGDITIGHSRELCKEGVVDQSKNADIPSDGGVFEVTEAEPFGPWMQVSYRKKSMTTVGTKTLNMKTGNSGIVRDNGVDSMNNIQPPSNGTEEFDTSYEAIHGMGKVGKGGSSRSAVKQGNKAIGGSRIGHSKELCKEGVVDQSKNADILGDGGVFEVTEAEPFGPWMQVSYRKKSMTTVGTKTLNMKTGNSGIVLDNGVNSMNNIQPPSNGAEEFDTGYEARHGMGKVGKGGSSRSAVKQGNKAIGGSRFEILSGDAEQNFGVLTNQNKSAKQIQSDSCKENVTGEGSRSLGSVTSTVKKDMNRNPNQSICMEKDFNDSEVLKELHQQMRDSVSTDKGTSLDIIENCGSECMEQVDLPAAINIKEVASKLKEAMEVVLE